MERNYGSGDSPCLQSRPQTVRMIGALRFTAAAPLAARGVNGRTSLCSPAVAARPARNVRTCRSLRVQAIATPVKPASATPSAVRGQARRLPGDAGLRPPARCCRLRCQRCLWAATRTQPTWKRKRPSASRKPPKPQACRGRATRTCRPRLRSRWLTSARLFRTTAGSATPGSPWVI